MTPDRLDATFIALADPTRRAILARLASGDASVMELAEPFAMSQPAISKHLKVLERAGLVSRGRDGQRRPCRLEAKPLEAANEWLERYAKFWEANFQRLDALLDEMKAAKKKPARHKRERTEKMTTHVSVNVTLPSHREIMMTRVFDAPRSMVFDCYTKPELLKRWMAPEGWQLVVCENDARIGSDFRWEWRKKNGHEMSVSGVYREIVRPERIVRTELFDPDWTGGETIGTLLLAEHDGTTVMTMSVLYASREARDTALEFGMKDGAAKSYAQLDALLASELGRSQSAA